jgi:hypothetical protein
MIRLDVLISELNSGGSGSEADRAPVCHAARGAIVLHCVGQACFAGIMSQNFGESMNDVILVLGFEA